jgi:uncharacterized protein YbjT (DUF2867 family)
MNPQQILVTGATGRTGSILVELLQAQPQQFTVRGFARSRAKAEARFSNLESFYFGDIRDPATLEPALKGCHGLVILTSAIPKIKGAPQPGQRPEFEFAPGEMPEAIDHQGQLNQIAAAKAAGVQQVVLVGSMGGRDPNHMLNKLGNGNILIWKRKAEQYLMESGLTYTIIRAGGLLDQPGGKRQLLVGQDDTLLNPSDGIPSSVPRADVARVAMEAFREPQAQNKAFDLISRPEDDPKAVITTNFAALLEKLHLGPELARGPPQRAPP